MPGMCREGDFFLGLHPFYRSVCFKDPIVLFSTSYSILLYIVFNSFFFFYIENKYQNVCNLAVSVELIDSLNKCNSCQLFKIATLAQCFI